MLALVTSTGVLGFIGVSALAAKTGVLLGTVAATILGAAQTVIFEFFPQ